MLLRTGNMVTRSTTAAAFSLPLTTIMPLAAQAQTSNTGIKFGAEAANCAGAYQLRNTDTHQISPILGRNYSAFWNGSDGIRDDSSVEVIPVSDADGAVPADQGSFLQITASATIVGALLLAVGIVFFDKLFGKKAPGLEAYGVDIHERETVPFDSTSVHDEDARPTVAETPEAMKKQGAPSITTPSNAPSFVARIGGEQIPGMSIMPPPDPSKPHGGRGIK